MSRPLALWRLVRQICNLINLTNRSQYIMAWDDLNELAQTPSEFDLMVFEVVFGGRREYPSTGSITLCSRWTLTIHKCHQERSAFQMWSSRSVTRHTIVQCTHRRMRHFVVENSNDHVRKFSCVHTSCIEYYSSCKFGASVYIFTQTICWWSVSSETDMKRWKDIKQKSNAIVQRFLFFTQTWTKNLESGLLLVW